MSFKHLPRQRHNKNSMIYNKVGKSLNNPEVKDLVGNRSNKQTKEILNSVTTP